MTNDSICPSALPVRMLYFQLITDEEQHDKQLCNQLSSHYGTITQQN